MEKREEEVLTSTIYENVQELFNRQKVVLKDWEMMLKDVDFGKNDSTLSSRSGSLSMHMKVREYTQDELAKTKDMVARDSLVNKIERKEQSVLVTEEYKENFRLSSALLLACGVFLVLLLYFKWR
ncbi:hypothetical protein [Pseudopedobacter beijingensis]|uniref:Uncharacterized protein n=1 Tax=Pseudopedobacter beijingensis TaxID=1207056 RepID=A0ABW4I9V1_9SPHI